MAVVVVVVWRVVKMVRWRFTLSSRNAPLTKLVLHRPFAYPHLLSSCFCSAFGQDVPPNTHVLFPLRQCQVSLALGPSRPFRYFRALYLTTISPALQRIIHDAFPNTPLVIVLDQPLYLPESPYVPSIDDDESMTIDQIMATGGIQC